MEYPYQLTAFLADEPELNEPVYSGKNGWYPQIALKRRFKLNGISESERVDKLTIYFNKVPSFTVVTGSVVQPQRMPVRIIEVEQTTALTSLHLGFISMMAEQIKSRYPERDGKNFLPHITTEYNGGVVLNTEDFINRKFQIDRVWLIKDVEDENSRPIKPFKLAPFTAEWIAKSVQKWEP